MALRDFVRRKPTSKAAQAHPGQEKYSVRKRARQRINCLELSRQAAWGGMTITQLRQANQREMDSHRGKGVLGAIRELWANSPPGRPWERYCDW